MKMLFGKIQQKGDPNIKEERDCYTVRLDDDDIVTGWVMLIKKYTHKNKDDYSLDEGEPVCILMEQNMRRGVILGTINTSKSDSEETDSDKEKKTFSDGSYFQYDRKNHVYDIYVKGSNNKINIVADQGSIEIKCKDATIEASNGCTIKGDVTVQGKIDASGDVKAGTVSLQNHVHGYVDTTTTGTVNSTTQPPTA